MPLSLHGTCMANNLSGVDLAGLIRRLKGDRSYERLAELSGGAISRQRWQQLGAAKSSQGMPDPATLHAVASVLGVPERVVVLAAARTAGLDVGPDGGSLSALLPPHVDRLTDRQVSVVLAVIRELLELSHAPAIAPTTADILARELEAQERFENESSRNGVETDRRGDR